MDIASVLDHSLLKADCTLTDIQKLCDEAVTHKFYSVCVPPYFVSGAVARLRDNPVKVATVIGFPMGYTTTQAKVEEIKRAINDGADELDVVVNIGAVKSSHWNYVKNDVESMTRITHLRNKLIKIIFETGLLEMQEIQQLCKICNEMEVDFVKTSTGFNGAGATPAIVQFLREELAKPIKIKASGGIRTLGDADQLIAAGANRLGTSAGVKILMEKTKT